MWNIFSSPLNWWQWLVFGLVPPAIVALYFLKLRRQPIEVPSTYLWHRTLEDMHVNSLWQRLRHNLLLLLQLVLIGLLMLACLRPNWMGEELVEDRAILLIDTSASMSTTDVEGGGTRLDEAKRLANGVIDRMKPHDVAMIISFSDSVSDILPFTRDRRLLRRRLDAIQPTQRLSDISEALRAAAGLANPGRSGDTGAGDTPAADPMPAAVYIFSDGRFRTTPQFSWGNLQPKYMPIGSAETPNIGIAAFSAQPIPGRLDKLQALVQIENYSDETIDVEMSLFLDGQLLDAAQTTIEAGKTGGADFTFDRPEEGSLRMTISPADEFMLDNESFAVINPPDRARLLVVTVGDESLETALGTEDVQKVAQVELLDPSDLNSDSYLKRAAEGKWDLIIYDDCRPPESPKANTLYLGQLPPRDDWAAIDNKEVPQIIDTDISHPLMRYLEFGNVTIAEGTQLVPPTGHRVLIDSVYGPLCAIAPRRGFEDVVLGFKLVATDQDGTRYANTNWPQRMSFPLFFRNVIQYLGGVASPESQPSVKTGQPIAIRCENRETLVVSNPRGARSELRRGADNAFVYQETDRLGVYEYAVAGQMQDASTAESTRRFAVNLFDPTESDIRPVKQFDTAWSTVKAEQTTELRRHEAWRWLVLLALGVLVLEWYVYNRRVFV
jgi:hypothetical protein